MSISDLLTSSLLFYPLGSKELTDSYTWIYLQAWEQSLEEQKDALLSGPRRDVGTPGLEWWKEPVLGPGEGWGLDCEDCTTVAMTFKIQLSQLS